MAFIFCTFFILLTIYLVWNFLTKKYVNQYKLYLLFGKKGCGKSTMLQKLAVWYRKHGYNVYCNIGDSNLRGVIPIPINDLPELSEAFKDKSLRIKLRNRYAKDGIKCPDHVKPHSVILCDEINLLWDNRDFKNFPKPLQKYFRLQRHYQHIFIGFSQTYDCDKKIRDLADYLIIVRRVARVWITSKAYVKKVVVISPDDDNSRETAIMTDDFVPMGLFFNLSSEFNAWLPKWVKLHDSFK